MSKKLLLDAGVSYRKEFRIMTTLNGRPSPEAIERAGVCFAYALRTLYGVDGTSSEDAARRAYTPTGPSLDELIERITDIRAQAQREAVQAGVA